MTDELKRVMNRWLFPMDKEIVGVYNIKRLHDGVEVGLIKDLKILMKEQQND